MPINLLLKRKIIPLLTGICLVSSMAVGLKLANPEALISDSFGRELTSTQLTDVTSWHADAQQTLWANIKPAVNTEAPRKQNLLAVGDQIMLTEPDQSHNPFRILRVEMLETMGTHIDTSLNISQQLLITAQNIADEHRPIITFTLTVDLPAVAVPDRPQDQTL